MSCMFFRCVTRVRLPFTYLCYSYSLDLFAAVGKSSFSIHSRADHAKIFACINGGAHINMPGVGTRLSHQMSKGYMCFLSGPPVSEKTPISVG